MAICPVLPHLPCWSASFLCQGHSHFPGNLHLLSDGWGPQSCGVQCDDWLSTHGIQCVWCFSQKEKWFCHLFGFYSQLRRLQNLWKLRMTSISSSSSTSHPPMNRMVCCGLNSPATSPSTVQFSYAEWPEATILKNVNLTIEDGECVAIIGSPGSSKSTIASLLQRLYKPSSGSVTIDLCDAALRLTYAAQLKQLTSTNSSCLSLMAMICLSEKMRPWYLVARLSDSRLRVPSTNA